ncbi:MAG: hypothetical protein DWQ47_06015 [Acidobacteria bacterium]|nr:MAG: hypothetical protein DWQ32_09565 [Acidobacteriota bacterium]REK01934.1 MAG: hypothetical protein DWQ38_06000 [Acidobacteriota bacterium]REK14890.1 MAG: hypothetical protein DWQ43_15255 [Acidobacteriota bacterium]REK45605.1 MAG: hypothetical protein DWQ47_06015 [Acidobacteriota bacterium]
MLRVIPILILLTAFAQTAVSQQRPLLTEDIDITPPGSISVSAGSDFIQNAKFPLSGLTGDLTRVGEIRVRTGYASNVEVQISGVIQDFLAINSRQKEPAIPLTVTGNSTNDFGDITTSVKIKLRNESDNVPALGFKFGYKMPNTNEKKGIGTNQTDIFTTFIAQKTFGKTPGGRPKLKVFGNLGLAILTAPLEDFSQNDVMLYGLAGVYAVNDRINLVSEVNGRISTQSGAAPLGTESQGQFRVGTQIRASGLTFDTAALFGLTKYSPRSGITFGVTYQSPKIFSPAQ